MLTSRLEAVFDEFLHKVKEECQMAETADVDQKKIRKNLNAQNYRYKEDKSSRLDDRPSFILKKRNVLPGWYSPLQSMSTALKTKYPKKFDKLDKLDKNHANAFLEERVESMNRRRDELCEFRELRKRDYIAPTTNVEPNSRRCVCKHHHKNNIEHIYDIPAKTRFPRNLHNNFRTEGASMTRPKLRPDYKSKKLTPMSAFTITSASLTHSSS